MDSEALAATIRPSADQLLAHARRAGLDAQVPSCPDWNVADLLRHMSRVHGWVTMIVERQAAVDTKEIARGPGGTGDDVLDFAHARADAVIDKLMSTDGSAPTWNWAGVEPATVAFWHRRMAQETAMHAADAALAAGADATAHYTPELAADGLDELLTVIAPLLVRDGLAGSLHVHCSDTDGEWLIEPDGVRITVRREHAKGDAALRGPAADLLLRLYNRGTGGEVIGDAAVLDSWIKSAKF